MNISNNVKVLDAVIVGAGFSGLYMLYRLREAGFSVRSYEAAPDVGGVWYANRYPGARCDSESIIYNYTFSEELFKEWTWSSRYPEQAEILRYLNFVADKFSLRKDIQFNTRIKSAHFNENVNRWDIETNDGERLSSKYFITGVGCLSSANIPKFEGIGSFTGDMYHTGRWPHEDVDFTGKRVGVIGTGSSGIQSIPVIARRAEQLYVFQRTPAYAKPAKNFQYDEAFIEEMKNNYSGIRKQTRESRNGYLEKMTNDFSAMEDTTGNREKHYQEAWNSGKLVDLNLTYNDIMRNEQSNETVKNFVHAKIAETIKDPELAEKLKPRYYFGAKRPVLHTDYYETFNMDHVQLVDVKEASITCITPRGIQTADSEYELDIIVFATGYDAMTGPLFGIDIRGREGLSLRDKWQDGADTRTYLGIANAGFPNFFMITGPESPSVLSNVPTSIEQHVEWIGDCIEYIRDHDLEAIEAQQDAEKEWSRHCREVADSTLYSKVDSWYTGANIEGKPRGFLIYLGGVDNYRNICDRVAAEKYGGFDLISSKAKETVPSEEGNL
ncbi:NAD(P)/FAD-dependent oxidoreductase [Sporosarcina sp. P1]|uniref:flavin-containing monooxygenase n=1 Tax=Sporosarcina sp. P1 TaxID=2048257 RepID=UPI0026F46D9B|nr:NAD(P)/FAD-dependent oxidoreductase [Sporosarcina sp. P1]